MLHEIMAGVRRDLPGLRQRADEVRAAAARQEPARDFAAALSGARLSVIAEIKRASPSRGLIAPELDPPTLAASYADGGAAAISVLTEPHHFLGSLDDLSRARTAVEVPVLRKDFVLDRAQVWEARAAGADALLLIVAALDDRSLGDLIAETHLAGMQALVEVHSESEVDRALAAGARMVGVNNRDLTTFEVNLSTAEDLGAKLDGRAITVAESGIWTPGEAQRMSAAGYDAVLVGESLVRAADPGALLAGLRGEV